MPEIKKRHKVKDGEIGFFQPKPNGKVYNVKFIDQTSRIENKHTSENDRY